MITNAMKAKMRAGQPVVGVFASIESPTTVELLGLSGVDFVMVDGEHNPIEPSSAANMFRAAEAVGVPALARIGENTQQVIAKFMDAGCLGVMTPMVSNGADAKRVVDSVKYPPMGRRGLAAVRANRFGLEGPHGEYMERANAETVVIVQIETMEGIEHADDIVATDGVDVVFLGPTDLSVALGVSGQGKHQIVLDTIEALATKITEAGKVAGTIARSPEEYGYWRDRSVGLVLTGANVLLAQATKQYVDAIHAIEEGR
ncbi:MAG: aldolase/citrate lyase family protein [Dehalococcoidia bacterium]